MAGRYDGKRGFPMTEPTPDPKDGPKPVSMEYASAGAVGLEFGISIAIGAFGGMWLDGKFGTEPWLLMAGVIFGSAAAFRSLYRFARKQNLDDR